MKVSVIQSSARSLLISHFCGGTWWGISYDFTNYYHSQLVRAQVRGNRTLAHSLLTAVPDLIPRISCIWYGSIGYIAAVRLCKVLKHLDTCLLRGSIPAVQESNSSPALALTLSFYLWQTGGDFLRAQTSALLEADTTLSLKVRVEAVTDNLGVSFGSFGVGCQGPTCPLGCLGLCLWSFALIMCQAFYPILTLPCSLRPWHFKAWLGFISISGEPKEGVMLRGWSVDQRLF